jgi:hypothetical protein
VEGLRETLEAELIGDLVLVDGSLRVKSIYGEANYLPVWSPGYAARVEGGAVKTLDASGQVVARVGEEVVLAGASIRVVWDSDAYQRLRRELPRDCYGPYWVAKPT